MIGIILNAAGYLFIGFLSSIFVFNGLSYTRLGEIIDKYNLVWLFAIIFTIFWGPIFLIWVIWELLKGVYGFVFKK